MLVANGALGQHMRCFHGTTTAQLQACLPESIYSGLRISTQATKEEGLPPMSFVVA